MSHRPQLLRRRIVLTGLASTAAGILAACGATSATTNTPAAPPPVGTSVQTTAAPTMSAASNAGASTAVPTAMNAPAMMSGATRRVAIEYWTINTGSLGGDTVNDLVKRFNDATPGITVTHKPYPQYPDVLMAVQAALAAKMPPAVAQVGFGYLRYAATGIPNFPVSEAAKRDATNGGTDWLAKNFAPSTLALGQVDGVQYGMPYGISLPLLHYNQTLLSQAGLNQPPQTFAELRDAARQIKDKTEKYGIYILTNTNFYNYQAMMEGNGARVLQGSGKDVRCGVDSPEAIEAMQLAQDMVLKDKSAANLPQAQGEPNFKTGDIAMIMQSNSALGNYLQSNITLGTAKFPTFDTKPRRLPVGGNALFIFATDADKQAAAWEWIKYLQSPDALTAWVKATGYLSPRLGISDDPRYLKPYFDGNRLQQPALDELPDIVPWVSWPGMNAVQATQNLVDATNSILSGADAATTLKDVAARVNQLVKG